MLSTDLPNQLPCATEPDRPISRTLMSARGGRRSVRGADPLNKRSVRVIPVRFEISQAISPNPFRAPANCTAYTHALHVEATPIIGRCYRKCLRTPIRNGRLANMIRIRIVWAATT
jgi:hypothetical protein